MLPSEFDHDWVKVIETNQFTGCSSNDLLAPLFSNWWYSKKKNVGLDHDKLIKHHELISDVKVKSTKSPNIAVMVLNGNSSKQKLFEESL